MELSPTATGTATAKITAAKPTKATSAATAPTALSTAATQQIAKQHTRSKVTKTTAAHIVAAATATTPEPAPKSSTRLPRTTSGFARICRAMASPEAQQNIQ
mgnify:CR=1 FL=1